MLPCPDFESVEVMVIGEPPVDLQLGDGVNALRLMDAMGEPVPSIFVRPKTRHEKRFKWPGIHARFDRVKLLGPPGARPFVRLECRTKPSPGVDWYLDDQPEVVPSATYTAPASPLPRGDGWADIDDNPARAYSIARELVSLMAGAVDRACPKGACSASARAQTARVRKLVSGGQMRHLRPLDDTDRLGRARHGWSAVVEGPGAITRDVSCWRADDRPSSRSTMLPPADLAAIECQLELRERDVVLVTTDCYFSDPGRSPSSLRVDTWLRVAYIDVTQRREDSARVELRYDALQLSPRMAGD